MSSVACEVCISGGLCVPEWWYDGGMKKSTYILYIFVTLLFVVCISHFGAHSAHAAVKCTFDRDLDMGIDGEDVRCLQKYLNGAGVTIAESGVGSPGNETSLFRTLTKEAVIRWQKAHGISPASGYFGPLSRAKYGELVNSSSSGGAATPPASPSGEAALKAQLANLLSEVSRLQAQATEQKEASKTGSDEVQDLILKTIAMIEDAEEQMDQSGDTSGESDLERAKNDLFDAIREYFSGHMDEAYEYADDAYDNAQDAFEDAGGETDEDKAEDMLDDIEDQIEDAWDAVKDADDEGKSVDEAEDLLLEAEDLFDEAKDLVDEGEYSDAIDVLEDIEDLLDDAIDAIGTNDAREAIEAAQEAIDNAREAIRDAEDEGEDVHDAEDLLDEAKDLLDDAEDAYDDGDFDEAEELAEEAEDRAHDARREV